jgi:hypothetical protein
METAIYGVINNDNTFIDISLSEKGAKNYATRNGYNIVGYRIGYNAIKTKVKSGKKWVDYKE